MLDDSNQDKQFTKVCRKCKIEQPLDNFHKNKQNRDGLQTKCKKCAIEAARANYAANAEARREDKRQYHKTHAEQDAKYFRKYREANQEKIKEYKRTHQDKLNTYTMKYYTLRRSATIPYGELNSLIISEAYELASLRTKLTGIKWNVDHVIPINNLYVCGLHVGINLQVIPAKDNKVKRNKLIPVADQLYPGFNNFFATKNSYNS
jgi:hypothetical protein